MTYENYTTKRKKFKDGHYYVITYNEQGKKVGQQRWYGTNKKGVSPSKKIKRQIVKNFNEKIAKKEIPYKEWRNQGYVVPSRIYYSELDMRFPFSYIIEFRAETDFDADMRKYITIQNRKPMTKDEIMSIIKKKFYEDYHIKNINSIKVEELLLKKNEEYFYTY